MSEPFGASWHKCDAGREGELIFRSENQSQLHECCKSLSEFVESTCTNTQANSELVTAEEDAGWKAWRCRYTSENAQKTSKDWAAKRRETAVLKYRETERGREIHIYILREDAIADRDHILKAMIQSCDRLWLQSLTEDAIRSAVQNARPGVLQESLL